MTNVVYVGGTQRWPAGGPWGEGLCGTLLSTDVVGRLGSRVTLLPGEGGQSPRVQKPLACSRPVRPGCERRHQRTGHSWSLVPPLLEQRPVQSMLMNVFISEMRPHGLREMEHPPEDAVRARGVPSSLAPVQHTKGRGWEEREERLSPDLRFLSG